MQSEIYNVNGNNIISSPNADANAANASQINSNNNEGEQTLALGAAQPGAVSLTGGVNSWHTSAADNHHTSSNNYSGGWNNFSNNKFVGIQNQGATCYLNSLIQSLYMTPEFRRGIYKFK